MKPENPFSSLLGSSADEKKSSRNRWLVWVSILLAGIFLYLALRDLDWRSFFATLRNAKYELMPLVLLWTSGSYFIRAMRWRLLLSAEKPISRPDAFWANMSGYLGNNFLPARAGELVRAAYANRVAGINLSFALAGGLSERLMDVIVLILLGSASLAVSGVTSGALQQAIRVMAMAAGAGMVVFLLLPAFGPLLKRLIEWLPFLNLSLKEKLSSFLETFLLGLRALLSPRRAAAFSLYTACIWLMDGLNIVLLGFALHIPITLLQAFVLLAGLGLSSAIPSTPGYVGVYQFAAVTALAPFGISKADALAFIVTSQILGYMVIGFWGMMSLWKLKK